MSAEVQLVDFLENYPAVTSSNFQQILSAKHEFAELPSRVDEKLKPGRGNYFNHQKFTHRYLRNYDDLLLISAVGTGKSCEVIGFFMDVLAEMIKSKSDPRNIDLKLGHFKKIIVLVKGKSQKNEFRNQLVCKCSAGQFETPLVKNATSEKSQKSNVTAEIKRANIFVHTFRSFANKINKEYPKPEDEEKLIANYSDVIFWVDEAHNLTIDDAPEDACKKNPEDYREKENTYMTLWRLLHSVQRCKRIVSTATPMINTESELTSLMNLILPANGKLPVGYDYRNASDKDLKTFFPTFPSDVNIRTAPSAMVSPYYQGQIPKNFDYKTATLQDLEPYFRGRIGYIRASDTGAVVVERGQPIDNEYTIGNVTYRSQLILYPTTMSELQTRSYMEAKNLSGPGGKNGIYIPERQASIFVFPDGKWGSGMSSEEKAAKRKPKASKKSTVVIPEIAGAGVGVPSEVGNVEDVCEVKPVRYAKGGFNRYINKTGDNFSATDEFKPWLTSVDYIATLSCKYAAICQLVIGNPGNCFVYGEYIEGSGIIALALCLEGLGLKRYNETTSMFVGLNDKLIKPFCSGAQAETNIRRVRQGIVPMPRYAILTHDTSDSKFQSIMEAMNSYENRHGDYIKVLISSRVGRDGINVNNVLQIHLIGGEWNQSAIYQAMSRGIRATSHEDLINEQKEQLIAAGRDPSEARVDINVYKHAAFADTESRDSIDLQMYLLSEYKDRSIKRIMRMMKQCAIGCQIHKARNIRPTDVDYSAECDYEKCDYKCVDDDPTEEDYSTYDILYSGDMIDNIIVELKLIYQKYNSLSLDNLRSLLPNYNAKHILMALEKIITERIQLRNRFGFLNYLHESDRYFFLDMEYPNGNENYLDAYYSRGLIAVERKNLSNVSFMLEETENEDIIQMLRKMDVKDPEFNRVLDSMNIKAQVDVLEDSMIRRLKGDTSEFVDFIIKKYSRMIFKIHEPVTELNKLYESLQEARPKRGRKPDPNKVRRPKTINITEAVLEKISIDTNTEEIYLHTLYSMTSAQTAYAVTSRFEKAEGKIRLLKPSEIDDGWYDVNDVELPIYNIFIRIEIAKMKKQYEEGGIYGTILSDGKFRIVDKTTEKPGAAYNKQKVNRGIVCTSPNKDKLIEVMYKLKINPPVFPPGTFMENDRQWLLNVLVTNMKMNYNEINTWDNEKLLYFIKWFSANIRKGGICDIIKDNLTKAGKMLKMDEFE